ncbi:universal stress protein [Halegenticoccus soli]|uniref:universal stress protein n=1 Tax=Halegenticoccus soli TaxID=1985678 RepID=UPI0018EDABE0|nr:universal stress protein [Halegenticoccus soli]
MIRTSAAESQAEKIFERARATAADRGIDVETEWKCGRPRDVIVNYLHENLIDQLVLGSHNRGAISRLVLGSVAETVVRRSPVPVTVIRERPSERN